MRELLSILVEMPALGEVNVLVESSVVRIMFLAPPCSLASCLTLWSLPLAHAPDIMMTTEREMLCLDFQLPKM